MRRGWIAGALALAFTLACGNGVGTDGPVVGGSCASHDDCVERCVVGGDYPAGTCTLSCVDDGDCPEGTLCVDDEGGICLLQCSVPTDCRVGYQCDTKDRRGAPGEVVVCAD